MSIIITSEVVLKELGKVLEGFSEERKEKIIRSFDTGKVFDYFKWVDRKNISELFEELQNMKDADFEIPSNAEKAFYLMVTQKILLLVLASLKKELDLLNNLSGDEKMNLLIDLKTSENLDSLEIILSDTIERDTDLFK